MRLGEICNVVRGSSPRPQGDPKYFGGKIPRLMIADITRDGKYVTPIIDSLTEEGANKSRPMKKGDVVIAVSGDPGRPCILAVDACIHDGFVGLRNLDENKILKSYLFCFLNYFKLANKRNAVGAIFQNLTTDQVKKIEIPEISINRQRNIVTILTQAENLITQRKESILLLDDLLKSTFLEMFGDPVRNEKGWDIKTIEQLVTKEKKSIKRGPFGGALKKEIFVEEGYLVYEQYHALNNDFTMARYFIDEDKFNELRGFEVKPDDIIISCSGVYLGKLAIIPKNAKKGIINQALLKLTLDQDIINNKFFVFLFSHNSFRNNLFGEVRGSGVPNFPPISEFKKFKFIYPSIDLQMKFVKIITKVETLKGEYQDSLIELENMYGVLSQKAFKGELKVNEYTNNEVLGMVAETKG
ncbi:restriction endonuclease subunit S [Flavobacterium frigoris]|uniref:Type I restriction enzyme, S subunit n=1 Tax=Flavobacterium frigoris TaxID=229204 RepID=A0A1H9RUV6_FLAFI|nr:restriction endonuclease subunit S [Flavobacterium frigoris]SER76582.1 type I restriction enzyme, S subunit [Flavobacterium frigoris]